MRLGLVDLWVTREKRSVVKAIRAWASLRVCSGVGALLQSPVAFCRALWPPDSCRDISGVSGVQGSDPGSVLNISFIALWLGAAGPLSQFCYKSHRQWHSGDSIPSSGPSHPLPSGLSLTTTPPVLSSLLIGPPPSGPAHSSPAPPGCTWLPNLRKLSRGNFSWVCPLIV